MINKPDVIREQEEKMEIRICSKCSKEFGKHEMPEGVYDFSNLPRITLSYFCRGSCAEVNRHEEMMKEIDMLMGKDVQK